MRILITGAQGQLAQDCQQVLRENFELRLYNHQELDITQPDQVDRTLTNDTPDLVLNCAAYNQVDDCETHRERAYQCNVLGPKYLALAAAKIMAPLIHISTNYVFDGKKTLPQGYTEEDLPSPLSYYGKTKWEGEQAVREISPRNLVIRTAWLYGIHGWNFPKTLLQSAAQGKSISITKDQFASFTWTHRLAEQIKGVIVASGQGLYHATAEGFSSRYEMAKLLFEILNIEVKIIPCNSDSFKTAAIRPKNSILENQRLKSEGINTMKPWAEDLKEFISRYKSELLMIFRSMR